MARETHDSSPLQRHDYKQSSKLSQLHNSQLKGCGQERPLYFSLKSNMAKTAPNLACQFVYTCRELPCTYFPPFLLRIPEIKYAKTL